MKTDLVLMIVIIFAIIDAVAIYILIGFLLSLYVVDDLLVDIIADGNIDKMADLYQDKKKSRMIDTLEILLTLLLPVNVLCLIIFTIIKYTRKKRGEKKV